MYRVYTGRRWPCGQAALSPSLHLTFRARSPRSPGLCDPAVVTVNLTWGGCSGCRTDRSDLERHLPTKSELVCDVCTLAPCVCVCTCTHVCGGNRTPRSVMRGTGPQRQALNPPADAVPRVPQSRRPPGLVSAWPSLLAAASLASPSGPPPAAPEAKPGTETTPRRPRSQARAAGGPWGRENTHGLGASQIQYRLFLANCSDLAKNLKDSVDNHLYFRATDGAAIIRRLFLGDSAVLLRGHLAWRGKTSLKVAFVFAFGAPSFTLSP